MISTVLYVIPSLDPGGAEHQTINQINYLIKQGNNNIRLLILSKHHYLMNKLMLGGDHIKILDFNDVITIDGKLIKQLPKLVRETRRYILQQNITDVIAVLPMAQAVSRLSLATLALSFRKSPALNAYFRDVYYSVAPLNTWQKKLFNAVSSILARVFDTRSLFISQAVLKDVSSHFYVRRTLVLPNSLTPQEIDASEGQACLQEKGLNQRGYLILLPGRLHFKKGHLLFLEAFAAFVKQTKVKPADVAVLFAGEGLMRAQIEQRIKKMDLKDYVFLIGNTDNALLLSLHKCADLVVIPSSHEGFGNVAIEGLMQQSLMLVSRTGGLAEIIRDGENGFTFENGNAASLRKRLLYLYEHRKHSLINRSKLREEFEEKYTVDRQLKAIAEHCKLELMV